MLLHRLLAGGLPRRRRHARLETEPARELLDGTMVGAFAHHHYLDTNGVRAGTAMRADAAEGQRFGGHRMQEEGSHVRLVRGRARDADAVLDVHLGARVLPPVEQPPQGTQAEIRREAGHGGPSRRSVEAQARQAAHGRRAPERCGRIQAADTESLPKNHTGAEEAHARCHLRRDSSRTRLFRHQCTDDDERRRARRNERIGAKPGQAMVPLPLEANERAQRECHADPDPELYRAHRRPPPRRGVREATLAAPLSRGRATPASPGRLRRHLPHGVLALTVPAPPRQASDAASHLSHRQRDAARDVLADGDEIAPDVFRSLDRAAGHANHRGSQLATDLLDGVQRLDERAARHLHDADRQRLGRADRPRHDLFRGASARRGLAIRTCHGSPPCSSQLASASRVPRDSGVRPRRVVDRVAGGRACAGVCSGRVLGPGALTSRTSVRTPATVPDRVARTARPAVSPMRSAASTAPSAALRASSTTSAPTSRAAATVPSTARRAAVPTSPPTSPVALTAPRAADLATPPSSPPIASAALIEPRTAATPATPSAAPTSCTPTSAVRIVFFTRLRTPTAMISPLLIASSIVR